ncbi:MAG: hypothetical protein IT372_16760 [Polyangiaceae bacterium]|nr:hypothetical protein [Polyangiaceae bacterium]
MTQTRAPCALTAAALLAAAALFAGAPARAEDLKKQFGSDAANAESVWTLIQKGVHFDLAAGLWVAQLSGGLTSLTNSMDKLNYPEGVTTTALDSVGTGHGLVREVRFGLEVFGNEAYFDYLSDKLFQTAEEEIDRHVDDPILREVILQIAGELRPDLKSLLGPDAKVWLRAEYGDFKGVVENGHVFASKNGRPYFARREEPWETSYFGIEAGVYPEGRLASDELKRRVGMKTGDEGVGVYARMRRFSRPIAIGFGTEADAAQFVLTDGAVTAIEAGLRADILKCNDYLCLRASGYMAPFTGYADIDYEGIGDGRGVLISTGGELRLSLPIEIGDAFAFGPYVGFRADYLLPLVSSETDASRASDADYNEAIEPWAIDYFFWGPSFGLMVKL